MPRLTTDLDEGTLSLGTVVSPESVSELIRSYKEGKLEAGGTALLEILQGALLDDYIAEAPSKRLPREKLLRIFFGAGNATLAALRANMSDRTARDWVEKFLVFAQRKMKREAARRLEFEAKQLQCQESCGRRGYFGPSFGSEKWTSQSRTSQATGAQWGGCKDCPLNSLVRTSGQKIRTWTDEEPSSKVGG